MKCPVCESKAINEIGYCDNCGWKIVLFTFKPKENKNHPYAIAVLKAKSHWMEYEELKLRRQEIENEFRKLSSELENVKDKLTSVENSNLHEVKELNSKLKAKEKEFEAKRKQEVNELKKEHVQELKSIKKEHKRKIADLKKLLSQFKNLINHRAIRNNGQIRRGAVGGYSIIDVEKQLKLDWAEVPSGEFIMGHNEYPDNLPQECKITHNYFITKYPITVEQWEQVMGKHLPNPRRYSSGNYPKVNVSWDDIQEFLRKLNEMVLINPEKSSIYRLPTEAEWEYAAKESKDSSDYDYSGSFILKEVGWYYSNSGQELQPVNQSGIKPNSLGIYGMSGNIYEWCLDSWTELEKSKDVISDPRNLDVSNYKVIRGGDYASTKDHCTVYYRKSAEKSERKNTIGFRIVCELRGV